MSDSQADGPFPDDWTHGDEYSYSPSRFDPDERPTSCLECGTALRGSADRATVGQSCPECGVWVWIA